MSVHMRRHQTLSIKAHVRDLQVNTPTGVEREKKKKKVKLPIPSSHSWLLLSFRVCAVIHTFCFAVSLSVAFETLQKVFINRIYKAPTGVIR